MAGVTGHVHGAGGTRRAVEGGGNPQQATQVQQGDEAQGGRGRGRKRRRRRKGAAGQAAQGAQQARGTKGDTAAIAAGGGAGVTGGGAGSMAGCNMGAMAGEATLGEVATTGAGGTLAPAATTAEQLALLGGGAAAAPEATPVSPLIQSALGQLGSSPMATQVLQSLATNGAQIETVSDEQMAAEFGGRTQGAFDPKTNKITIPASVANNPQKLRLVLFHEGVHWLQDNVKGGAEALGGPIGQALQSAGAVRQTTPGTKGDLQHDEAQAYVLEAMLANELNIKDSGLGVDQSGRALGYDAVLQRVKQTAEYA